MECSAADSLSLSPRPAPSHLRAARLVADLHQRALADTSASLRDLITSAAESVPGARYAGITVTRKRRHSETAAASHPYCVLLDEVQNHCQQGPCLTAAGLQRAIRIDDLARDDRWPLFREKAIAELQYGRSCPSDCSKKAGQPPRSTSTPNRRKRSTTHRPISGRFSPLTRAWCGTWCGVSSNFVPHRFLETSLARPKAS